MENKHIVSVDSALCIRCGLCVKDCPHGYFKMTAHGAEVIAQDCNKCGHCVAVCPKNAVSMSGFDFPPEELPQDMTANPDALTALIKSGRSMRRFTDKDVSLETISHIIEAGRYTPTAENKQGVSYAVLRENIAEYESTALLKLRRMMPLIRLFAPKVKHLEIGDDFFFKGAPVVVVIKSPDMVDGALAASAMEIAARTHGLGVLYSGFFTRIAGMTGTLKRKLGVARREKIVTTLVLGYPAVTYQRIPQREKAKVIFD